MRLFLTAFSILIVAIFFKWLWQQTQGYDKKSLRWLGISFATLLTSIIIISELNIEHYRISSSIQGVITQLDTYRLRGQITHYSLSIRGLAKSGSLVATQESVTVKNDPDKKDVIDALQKAHRERKVVFIEFDTVTSYFFGDDYFELQKVILSEEEKP